MDPHLLPDHVRNPQAEKPKVNPMLDFVNTFGLGDAEGSAEWRDQKLYALQIHFRANSQRDEDCRSVQADH